MKVSPLIVFAAVSIEFLEVTLYEFKLTKFCLKRNGYSPAALTREIADVGTTPDVTAER